MKRLGLAVIRAYQRWVSPSLPPACRYQATCSHYGYESIEKHGLLRGSWLTLSRLVRCNPFVSGGYDPVP